MYEIKLHVRENGTLDTGLKDRLRLGTEEENQRTKLVFEIDDSVEGIYHYLKLVNGSLSCLYRVKSKSLVLNKTVTSKEGVWLVSFISTNELITNGKLSGEYTFITEPIEAVVVKGIMNTGTGSAELESLIEIIGMNFSFLRILEGIETIGSYFLYDSRKTFALEIGPDVRTIKDYTFYKAIISNLTFSSDCILKTLEDYAFYNVTINSDVIIPKSLSEWGKHAFQYCAGGKALKFEKNSSLKTLGSYAIWQTEFTDVELPDGLQELSGNTYVINNNTKLKRLWIPNTITTVIPANAIYGNTQLTEIVLEQDFNVSANFSNCYNLTQTSIVNMLYALKNLNGQTAKTLTLGSTNLDKLSDAEKAIATNKNWTLS